MQGLCLLYEALLIISVNCGFVRAQPSQSTAKNSPQDCFLNTVTVLLEIIRIFKFIFTQSLCVCRGFVFSVSPMKIEPV